MLPSPATAEPIPTDSLTRARSNCVLAIAKVVGLPSGSLSVIRDQREGASITVEVRVPKAVAPWACLTNSHGIVKDVYFMGSEGAS